MGPLDGNLVNRDESNHDCNNRGDDRRPSILVKRPDNRRIVKGLMGWGGDDVEVSPSRVA